MKTLSIIGNIADILALITIVIAVAALLQTKVRIWRYIKNRSQIVGPRPWAVCVSIPPRIEQAVRKHISDQGLDMSIKTLDLPNRVTSDDLNKITRGLLDIKTELTSVAATEVHLFYKGPVTVATLIGFVFDNWVPVKVYEFTGGTYQLFGVLEKETIKTLLVSGALQETASALD